MPATSFTFTSVLHHLSFNYSFIVWKLRIIIVDVVQMVYFLIQLLCLIPLFWCRMGPCVVLLKYPLTSSLAWWIWPLMLTTPILSQFQTVQAVVVNMIKADSNWYENINQRVVLRVPASAPPPDTLLSAGDLHTLLCTSRPPALAVAIQSTQNSHSSHPLQPQSHYVIMMKQLFRFSASTAVQHFTSSSPWIQRMKKCWKMENCTTLQMSLRLLIWLASKNKPSCISQFQTESPAIVTATEPKPAELSLT